MASTFDDRAILHAAEADGLDRHLGTPAGRVFPLISI